MKKTLSLLLALVLLVSLLAGLSIGSFADEAALEVYTQTGEGKPVLAKSYTSAALSALKETTAGTSYVYYKKDNESAVTATEYVTLSALLTDAGVSFAAGSKLAFTCADGPYAKGDFSYEALSARGIDAAGTAVPTAFALTWTTGKEAGTGIRFVCGMTETEKAEKSAAGNRMPGDVVAVTVVSPDPSAQPTTQALKVNGVEKTTEVYSINGYNYFKLRDIAMLLNGTGSQFAVDYAVETHSVFLTTGTAYTPVGGELTTGTDKSGSCITSNWTVQVNGESKTVSAYILGGNNFYKLRDLGEILGFGVDYDEATRTMLVTSK